MTAARWPPVSVECKCSRQGTIALLWFERLQGCHCAKANTGIRRVMSSRNHHARPSPRIASTSGRAAFIRTFNAHPNQLISAWPSYNWRLRQQ